MSLLLVAGCTRSGTTLLSRALNRHPDIFVAPETQFFTKIWSQRRLVRDRTSKAYAARAADILEACEYPELGLFRTHRTAIEGALTGQPNLHRQFLALLSALSEKAPILAEKTPWHTPLSLSILAAHPTARLLAIVRHPAATVASVRGKASFRRVSNVLQCSARWMLMNRAVLDAVDTLGPERAMLVRYEDLTLEPGNTLAGICQFLGIAPDAQMETPGFSDSSHPGLVQASAQFDPGRTELWRSGLSPEDQKKVLQLTAPLARKFGYDVPFETASLAGKAALEAEIALQSAGVWLMRLGVYPFGGLVGPSVISQAQGLKTPSP